MITCPHYTRTPGNRRHGNCAQGYHRGRPLAGQCRLCLAGGPGTKLKLMLGKWGIHAEEGCPCNKHAAEMDRQGPDWCEANIETIMGWVGQEAARRGLPYLPAMGRWIVRRAIQQSRLHPSRIAHARPVHQS